MALRCRPIAKHSEGEKTSARPKTGDVISMPPSPGTMGRRILAFFLDTGLIFLLVLFLTTTERNSISETLQALYQEGQRIAAYYPDATQEELSMILWTRLPLPPDFTNRSAVLRLRNASADVQTAARAYWSDCASLWVVCFMCYTFVALGWWNTTIGKRLLKLNVIQVNGAVLGWRKALQRTLLYLWSGLPFAFGFYWAFLDADRRTWHDRIAGTIVVSAARASIEASANPS
jgi:uncharacterized RDD family membrane protein YckC